MDYTAHSEIGKIKSVFVKPVIQAFIGDSHLAKNWKGLNYLGKPDFNLSLDEYENFLSSLKVQGAEIYTLPEDETVNMDSIYCRDASIATNKGMIICNMEKAGRTNEPAAEKRAFDAEGIPVLAIITAPGTVEGGDVTWLDELTLAVGLTYRTNDEGIRQLTEILKPLNVEIITVPPAL